MLKHLDEACVRGDQAAIRAQLRKIVPEFTPSSEIDDHFWKKVGGSFNAEVEDDRTEARA
jgi:hypothetical protein